MIKRLNKRGSSLIEVIVAGSVFVLSIAGFYTAMNAARKPVEDSQKSMVASRLAKEILESMRVDVTGTLWADPNATWSLKLGTWNVPGYPKTVDGIAYTATYTVEEDLTNPTGGAPRTAGDLNNPRKVSVSVTW